MSEIKKYYDMGLSKVRTFSVKFLGPTNTLGSRIMICDEGEKSNNHDSRRFIFVFSYDNRIGCGLTQAIGLIEKAGFNILSYSELLDSYLVHVNSHEYKNLKNINKKGS
jgi:hypothetical protein